MSSKKAVVPPAVPDSDSKIKLRVRPKEGLLQIPSTGTSFGLNLINKKGISKKVPIQLGPKPNLFYALFDQSDVDFEIICESGDFMDLSLELGVHREQKLIVLKKGEQESYRALETRGDALHFVRLSSDDGQALVAGATEKFNLSFGQASKLLSRMSVKLEFGTLAFPVHVKLLSGRHFDLKVFPNSRVRDLKRRIFAAEGIPVNRQCLLFRGKCLQDGHKIEEDCKIGANSEIQLMIELKGAADLFASSYDLDSSSSSSSASDEENEKSGQNDDASESERGVICFGGATNEYFVPGKFKPELSREVEPFIVEMRMKSKYHI